MIRVKHDPDTDAASIYLANLPYSHGKELDERRRVDYAADGTPIGVELLYVRDGVDLSGLPDEIAIGRLIEKYNLKVFA